MARTAELERTTGETQISLAVNLDGTGSADIETGIGFFDHMLTLLASHGRLDLRLRADGDLHVDAHHSVEDVGIVFGSAVYEALGEKEGVRRYGHFTLPMDECLVTAAVDFGGRPYFVSGVRYPVERVGNFDLELIAEFWQAFSVHARCNLHQLLHHGENSHHIAEAVFKATSRAIRMAVESDPRVFDIPSTKGTL
jgi:imidazoleglycerol-phosphate dehydratase